MLKPHHNYDPDFRRNAVDLLLSSGRPLKVLARELGVSPGSLRGWRDKALGKGTPHPPVVVQTQQQCVM